MNLSKIENPTPPLAHINSLPLNDLDPEQVQPAVEEFTKERRASFQRKLRAKLDAQVKAILEKDEMPLSPLHPDRPYGLPKNYENSRLVEDVWEKVLKYIEEPQDILNLSEVSSLFPSLLHCKLRSVKVLQVARIYANKIQNDVPLPIMDCIRTGWVSTTTRRFFAEFFSESATVVHPADLESIQGTLMYLQEHRGPIPFTFMLRRIDFDERFFEDKELVRSLLQKMFEFVGNFVVSLSYYTQQSSSHAYRMFRGWVALLPNLQRLAVGIGADEEEPAAELVEPFPKAPKLTTFLEDKRWGLSSCHLEEVVKANPTISKLKLTRSPEHRLEELVPRGVLDNLSLQKFSSEQKIPQLERRLKWPLKKLELEWPGDPVPRNALFGFINQFGETLEELTVILNLEVSETGGMLKMPHLTRLDWWLGSESDGLGFMIPLESLKFLKIYVPIFTRMELGGGHWKERTLKYLEGFGVPQLYPAMRKIIASRQFRNMQDPETIWKFEH